jgi:hypothetical protein
VRLYARLRAFELDRLLGNVDRIDHRDQDILPGVLVQLAWE